MDGVMQDVDHEVVQAFKEKVHPLSNKLTEMFNEHYQHQMERRGCGYTQATRVLAEYINVSRPKEEFTDLKLFQDYPWKNLKKIIDSKSVYQLDISDWRNLDLNKSVNEFLNHAQNINEYSETLKNEVETQNKLRTLFEYVNLEESKIVCQILADIILPKSVEETGYIQLPVLSEKPKVGSCPMAENFFLKIAHGSVLRQGQINIIVDQDDKPLFIEKMNMGDDHSCISLQEVLVNGVRIPKGSLFSLDYEISDIQNKRNNKQFKGYVIPYTELNGFWFLRLTTLAISPENRKRAFSTHYEQQVQNGLYSPGTTQLSQLYDVAIAQI